MKDLCKLLGRKRIIGKIKTIRLRNRATGRIIIGKTRQKGMRNMHHNRRGQLKSSLNSPKLTDI